MASRVYQVGDEISLRGLKGIIKFIGEHGDKNEMYIGIELYEPKTKANGTIKGRKIFNCKDNHGLFTSLKKVRDIIPNSEFVPGMGLKESSSHADLSSIVQQPSGRVSMIKCNSSFFQPEKPPGAVSDTDIEVLTKKIQTLQEKTSSLAKVKLDLQKENEVIENLLNFQLQSEMELFDLEEEQVSSLSEFSTILRLGNPDLALKYSELNKAYSVFETDLKKILNKKISEQKNIQDEIISFQEKLLEKQKGLAKVQNSGRLLRGKMLRKEKVLLEQADPIKMSLQEKGEEINEVTKKYESLKAEFDVTINFFSQYSKVLPLFALAYRIEKKADSDKEDELCHYCQYLQTALAGYVKDYDELPGLTKQLTFLEKGLEAEMQLDFDPDESAFSLEYEPSLSKYRIRMVEGLDELKSIELKSIPFLHPDIVGDEDGVINEILEGLNRNDKKVPLTKLKKFNSPNPLKFVKTPSHFLKESASSEDLKKKLGELKKQLYDLNVKCKKLEDENSKFNSELDELKSQANEPSLVS